MVSPSVDTLENIIHLLSLNAKTEFCSATRSCAASCLEAYMFRASFSFSAIR